MAHKKSTNVCVAALEMAVSVHESCSVTDIRNTGPFNMLFSMFYFHLEIQFSGLKTRASTAEHMSQPRADSLPKLAFLDLPLFPEWLQN